MKEILFVVAFGGLWIVSYFLASIAIDHQVRLERLEDQFKHQDGKPFPRLPLKRVFLLGLISSEQILDPPMALEPCKKCGSTDVYLHSCKILRSERWLVYCPHCDVASYSQKTPYLACTDWNNNPPYEK